MARSSRMLRYINYRMRITLQDSRVLVGTFMAFDRHMNIVLGDTEEFRRVRSKKGSGLSEEREEKRALGLIILRGDSVISLTIEGPPPPELNEKLVPGGPGAIKAVGGRGVPVGPFNGAPSGLAGPVRGVGGPGMIMQPPVQIAAHVGAQPFPPRPGMPPVPGMLPPGVPRPPMIPGMPIPPGIPRPPMIPGMPPRGPVGMPLPPRGL